eukprot:g1492.t1
MGDKQINQMCKFILQEAKEKANEISIKTNHDFNKEKQLKVLNAKKKIDAQFAAKMERLDSDRKVERSKAIGAARRKKGLCAHDLVQKVKLETLEHLRKQLEAKPTEYEELVKNLLVEALVKLNETTVTVECLGRDSATVTKVLPAALAEYKAKVKALHASDAGKYESQLATSEKCTAAVDSSRPLSEKTCIGGVKCVGLNGRIVCDNTLNTRLNLTAEALLPTIRATLFPQLA